jgi:hypothetical protein
MLIGTVAGDPAAVFRKSVEALAEGKYLLPICSAMGFAYVVRAAGHRWEPRRQRPEMWQLLNGRLGKGETVRVFPLSNWTEGDVWRYIALEKLDVVPLYFAAERPVVTRNGQMIVVDDERMRFEPKEKPVMR